MANNRGRKPGQKMARGFVGSTVAANLKRIREDRRLSLEELSEKLGEIGVPMLPSTIWKKEAGSHRVDVDDLVAFAVALNVSPLWLLLPASKDAAVSLAPNVTVSAKAAFAWAEGAESLTTIDLSSVDDVDLDRYLAAEQERDEAFHDARPRWLRHLDAHQAVRPARSLLAATRNVADAVGEGLLSAKKTPPKQQRERVRKMLGTARRSVQRVVFELDAIDEWVDDEAASAR